MPALTDDQIARAKRMVDAGLDVEQVAHWLADIHERERCLAELRSNLITEIKRLRAETKALAIDRDALRLCVQHLRSALYQERCISQELRSRIAGAVASGSWDDLATVEAAEASPAGEPKEDGDDTT